ncbi:MAG: hypothetical protein HFF17_03645 [Oscillospiraceae bacterium]|nr:hypothetical protein [Oscillospiraceae bacterium]
MSDFQAGFARVNVTPPMGVSINGYFFDRFVEGVLDELEANAVALSCGGQRAVVIALDNCEIDQYTMDRFRGQIARDCGVEPAAILVHTTHTHVAPFVGQDPVDRGRHGEAEYEAYLTRQLSAAAQRAFADLKPARAGWAVGQAPGISFLRRFRMKDGSIRTNPGVGNPDIAAPIGEVDERVNVVRIVRQGGADIVIANFGVHPDTVGGSKVTADYPGFARRTLERALPHTRCVFLNGAQGDVNHVNVHARGGDFNGLELDSFDDVARGYEHAAHMGRVIAGGVLQVYTKAHFAPVEDLRFAERRVDLPSNMPTAEEMVQASRFVALHQAGRDCDIPFEGMELTTVVAESLRMQQLEHGPESFPLRLTAVAFGPIALLGIPGEPFTGIGLAVKAGSKFPMTMPCCLTNGSEGYFPMQEAYDEGGYEARSSCFRAGVAERIAEESLTLLNSL